jgi:prepilin-type N-terminal cleavage/methylation domain-containing protein
MKMPKRGEKGFTLIELLIVIAILGVLAAVVIPNVGRFIGAGEEEAAETEFSTIQAAVHAMMVDNEISELPDPVETGVDDATNDMTSFPDTSTVSEKADATGLDFQSGDGEGFVLYACDIWGDGAEDDLVNYVATNQTSFWYTTDEYGTITQSLTAP